MMTDPQNSNVVQFISMLKKDNKREQMVYYQVTVNCRGTALRPLTPQYQSGIGTYTSSHAPGFINSISRRFSKALDQAVAWSLPLHTQGAYTSMFFVRSKWTDAGAQLDTNF
jgi:uncharacterized protein (DUF2235 family)